MKLMMVSLALPLVKFSTFSHSVPVSLYSHISTWLGVVLLSWHQPWPVQETKMESTSDTPGLKW